MRKMENFLDINKVAGLLGLSNNSVEVCPDCQEPITADNELIDPDRYSTQFGSCVSCCDPTPYYPKID